MSRAYKENCVSLLFQTFILSIFCILSVPGFSNAANSSENPISAEARVIPYEIEPHQIAQLEISIHLSENYKAYEDQFKIKIESPLQVKVGSLAIAPLHEIFDKFSKKDKKVIKNSAKIQTALSFEGVETEGEQKIILNLTYQACTESYCLFPKTIPIEAFVKIKKGTETSSGSLPLSFSEAQKMGLVWTFLFVFAFGFLTSFTPCVYPMIPITMAILGREAHARSRWQNLSVSLAYVTGIGVTFSSLGILAATSGMLFGSFMSSPWVLGFITLVFIGMSLSMFGLFELEAPVFLRDGILSHLRLHGYIGAFVSGLLAGVIASPCVGPVLVGILTYIAQTKNLFLGFWLMFAYSLGMGIIFLAIGFSTNMTKLMPKSGAWMNRVKYFFGVLLLLAALYYLDVLLVSSKFIEKSFVSSASSLFQKSESKSSFALDTIQWQKYSEDLLKRSVAEKRPVLIDFRADWCAACLEMEEKTFTSQGVQVLSSQFIMVKFDATQDSPELEALKEKYQIMGLPTLIFINRQGQWEKGLTLTAFEEAGPFAERMNKALQSVQ